MVEAIVEVTITEVTEAEVDTTKTVGVIIPVATQILADATEEIQTEGSIIRKNLRNLPQVRAHFTAISRIFYRILPQTTLSLFATFIYTKEADILTICENFREIEFHFELDRDQFHENSLEIFNFVWKLREMNLQIFESYKNDFTNFFPVVVRHTYSRKIHVHIEKQFVCISWFHELRFTSHHFSITGILREIKFRDSWTSRSAIFAILEAQKFDFVEFLLFLMAEIYSKSKFKVSVMFKMALFRFSKWPKLITRKINWQENCLIFALSTEKSSISQKFFDTKEWVWKSL